MTRLAAIDLDGTLLRDDGTVSARSRVALERARAADITSVLVTARPPRALRVMARRAGVTGLAICCNGAIVYDLAADAIVEHTALPATAAHRLIAALRRAAPDVCFAVEHGLDFGQEPRYAALDAHTEARHRSAGRQADALALCAAGVTKLIVRHPTRPLGDLLLLTRALVGDTAAVTHSGAPFVEVAAPGVTKARALAALCARLGIGASQVVAFGDMPNDLPMLRWAGHAVAVANHADGVALVIERLLAARRA